MPNRLLTVKEFEELVRPELDALQEKIDAELVKMKPGETRVYRNPFGSDLIPFSIKKPLKAS
jgi:hypothetical protein